MALLLALAACSKTRITTITQDSVVPSNIDFQKTTITAGGDVVANGSTSHTITVVLKNNDDTFVENYTPTFSVAPSVGVTSGSCTASNSFGISTCTLQSTSIGTKVVTLTNAKTGLAQNFTFVDGTISINAASAPTTPVASRTFTTTWTLTGACDPALGAVRLGGNGIATALANFPLVSTTCDANNTYSFVINATCGVAPCMNHYSNEVTVFQGGKYSTTRLYPYASAGITFVSNAAELQAAMGPNKTIILTNDIDLSSIPNWTPYASASNMRFYGDGHTISNLTINGGASNQVGFFSTGNTLMVIDSVKFTNASVQSTGSRVGGVIGYANNAHLFNVSFSGTVNGNNYVGGLIGYQNNGYIAFFKDCTSFGTITGTGSDVGGLIGGVYDFGGTRNYSSATVTGSTKVGGLIGELMASAGNWDSVENMMSSGSITCTAVACTAGGLIGEIDSNFARRLVTLSYFSGTITAPASGVTDKIAGLFDAETDFASNYYLQTATCDHCKLLQGTPLTAAQMKISTNFVGFDFTTVPYWTNTTEGVTMPLPKR